MGRITQRRRISHLAAGGAAQRSETLAVEEPLEIRLGGAPLTVTMRTPGSDFELAQGFLLTEGIIAGRDDVVSARYCGSPDATNTYNVLDVTLAPDVPPPAVDITRNFYATSSCGICGKASLDAVRLSSRYVPGDDPIRLPPAALTAMPAQLRAAQDVFAATGVPILAALSAPSSLAVDLAGDCGLTLVAFLRGESMNIDSRADRITGTAE